MFSIVIQSVWVPKNCFTEDYMFSKIVKEIFQVNLEVGTKEVKKR